MGNLVDLFALAAISGRGRGPYDVRYRLTARFNAASISPITMGNRLSGEGISDPLQALIPAGFLEINKESAF